MKKFILIVLLMPFLIAAQQNPLHIFRPLEDYIWTAEGKWNDGSIFKQEIEVSFILANNLVIFNSKGFTDKNNTKFQQRNHGVRQYDEKTGVIRFWEFDIFGIVTEGTVKSQGKNFIYNYKYEGTEVTEMWIYKSETVYTFIVGVYKNNTWEQVFLETEFKGRKKTG